MKPVTGWVLVSKDDNGKDYICWHEVFEQRKRAVEFATVNKWPKPWKPVRGKLAV